MNLILLRFGQEGTKERVIGIRPAGVEQTRWKNALDTLSRRKQNGVVLQPDFSSGSARRRGDCPSRIMSPARPE
jgi:hypothetical protein